MTKKGWETLDVQTYGLSSDLFVPIAAKDINTIEKYVGTIIMLIPGRKRPANALVIEAHRPNPNPLVPLWNQRKADQYYSRLHPLKQLWVHVDYTGYRRAWERLGFGKLSSDVFLDHIRNRATIRLCGYRRPFLRLCPVSRETNTSGGLDKGSEGMEKTELRKLKQQPLHIQQRTERCLAAPVVLADPIDLTKMLNIPPGLYELQGVASMLLKFYTVKD
ncbi:MAG: hypothetical protein HQ534_06670 [Armatimonadetes bacterium]|nr:hypothetical protein [Armatimonadota bacterium]